MSTAPVAPPASYPVTLEDIRGAFITLCGRPATAEEEAHLARQRDLYKWNHYSLLIHILCYKEAQNRLEFPLMVKSGVMVEAPLHNGMTLYGPISDLFVTHTIRRKGQWEPHEEAVLRRIVRPGMRALDIGANIGYFTAVLSEVVGPQGHVWAVEAAPRLAECLKKSIEKNNWKNVTLLTVAASTGSAELMIGYSFTNFGGSTVFVNPPGRISDPLWEDPVSARRLDDTLPEATRLDFIKMDIEGHEGHALAGMERILKEGKPTILFEYTPAALEQGPLPPGKLFAWLEQWGYKFETIKALKDEPHPYERIVTSGLSSTQILQATQVGNYPQWNLVAAAPR